MMGCDEMIVLGDANTAVCLDPGCGGAPQSESNGLGGSLAGTPSRAGSPPVSLAGGGGSPSSDGGDAGNAAQGGEGPSPPGCQASLLDGTSYLACLAALDFDHAESACQAQGMHLVKIDSAQENATVLSLAPDDYVWIGGSNRADERVYVWLDGTPFYDSGAAVGGTYENFGTSEPASDPELRCVQLRQLGGGTWSNWRCSGMQSFVCERPAP
jgi:hypothetical protein